MNALSRALCLSLILLPSAACHGADKLKTGTLKWGGQERSYHVYLPKGYSKTKSWPLVLALHGGGGKGKDFNSKLTGGSFRKAADKHGFIVVYPEGIEKGWNDGRKDLKDRKPELAKSDDVGFLSKVIDVVVKKHKADAKRVYATGMSNGGFMSNRLGVELSKKLAAIAPVCATMGEGALDEAIKKPIGDALPVLIMNGTKDDWVLWDGGTTRLGLLRRSKRSKGKTISTKKLVNFWVKRNKAKSPGKSTMLPNKDIKDKTRVKKTVYAAKTGGAEVVLYTIEDGGHTWPGGRQYLGELIVGATCQDIDASDVILRFFKKHAKS